MTIVECPDDDVGMVGGAGEEEKTLKFRFGHS